MKRGSDGGWTTLSKEDLHQARMRLAQRRSGLEAPHAEIIKALQDEHARARSELEAKLAEIDEFERMLDAFAAEFLAQDQRAHTAIARGGLFSDGKEPWQEAEKHHARPTIH